MPTSLREKELICNVYAYCPRSSLARNCSLYLCSTQLFYVAKLQENNLVPCSGINYAVRNLRNQINQEEFKMSEVENLHLEDDKEFYADLLMEQQEQM